jgi:hypothetical protein
LRASADTFRALAERSPGRVSERRALVKALIGLAESGPKDAAERAREGLALAEPLARGPRAAAADRTTCAVVLNNLGEIVGRGGNPVEAKVLLARSAELFGQKGPRAGEAERLHHLAYVRANQADAERRLGHPDEALAFLRESLDREVDAAKLAAAYKGSLLAAYDRLGTAMVERGDHAGTAALAFQMARAFPDSSAARLKAAGLLARCADVARTRAERPEPERAALAHAYALKGIAQVRVVIDSGFKSLDTIRNDAALRGLLGGPESRELLPEVIASARQGGD